jgi:hypothetical protein
MLKQPMRFYRETLGLLGPRHIRHIFGLVLAGLVSGCAGGSTLSTAALVQAPGAVLSNETLAALGNTPTLAGASTDVYARVARGALTCWFGANGPLKASHIFNAEAAPPSKGGAAEIVVHERDPTQPSPKGMRVFRISFTAESEDKTRLSLQAGKLPPDLAQAMEKDTLAWGFGRQSCEAQVVRPPPPPPEPEKVKPKKRSKLASG